jgi:histidinol phosphatase-like PHP family hydrolase
VQLQALFDDPPELADPPALRAGFRTWTMASENAARFDAAVLGDLQTHTVWSDGHSTVSEMAAAARDRGYRHLLLTEHSKGLPIAGGLDEARLRAQRPELEAASAEAGIRMLQGLEMNIDPHGDGDMEPGALAELDVVLGAFHSKLRLRDDQTERYLAAIRNPWVDVLAHPRCRIWNFRLGLWCDWPAVFREAALLDKAVEVDGYADRQDLNIDLLEIARDCGCRISLGSDSHHVVDLGFITFSIGAVVEAGIDPERVINCMPADDLVAWAHDHRRRAVT